MKTKANHYFITHCVRRSGSHFIIDWVFSQFKKPSVFINDVNNRNFLHSLKNLHKNEMNESLKLNTAFCKPTKVADFLDGRFNIAIASYENILFNDIVPVPVHSDNLKHISILRDILNTYVSYYFAHKRGISDIHYVMRNFFKWWSDVLDHMDSNECIGINYNRFISDEHYRNSIADKIHVDYRSDEALNVKSWSANFAFPYRKVNHNDVLNRYKMLPEIDAFALDLLADNWSLVEKSMDYFSIKYEDDILKKIKF